MAGETTYLEPNVESIRIKGELLGSFDAMAAKLSTLQMFSIKPTPALLTLINVESRNIQKKPFLFYVVRFSATEVSLDYSIGPDTSAKIRRLSVLKGFLSVLSLVSDQYRPDNGGLFQQLDSAVEDVLNSITQQYSSLYNNYDSLFNKYRELKRLNIELTASNKNLSVQATMLSGENTELKSRLKELETYSDESLMALVEEWIESHDGAIDINEFAGTYKIASPRVEQILNKMVSLGYIELKG